MPEGKENSKPGFNLDLRQHFALERTLLAYLRTGLALIGLGFVMARFGLLLQEIGLRGDVASKRLGLSIWIGSALVFLGGAIGPIAVSTYYRQLRRLNASMGLQEQPVAVAVGLSVLLALVGGGMGAYLLISG